MATKPTKLHLKITGSDGSTGTAVAKLLWDKAPQTCKAIADILPFESTTFHGRNSGDEALTCTPKEISHVPQDATENATTTHHMGGVFFGYEPAGFCYGGADANGASEIAWVYGPAAQAQYWVSVNGPPHTADRGPFKLQHATLNHFAEFEEEQSFYDKSRALPKTGQQKIEVWGA